MANTYVDYTATAAQQYFAFNFPYLEDEHVVVEIEGVDQTITTNYTIETSPTQRINLSNPTTALAGGELVRIKRRSAPNTNLVDFQNGSVLTESELDRAYLHNRYLAEEATEGVDAGLKELEGSTNYNAGNKQIKNLADGTLATDAVNKQYVDTQIALSDTNLAGFYKSTHTGNGTDNVFTLSFTPQTTDAKAYIVSIDGLVQVPDTDYTIGATAITFNTIPANSAEICVVATAAASVATVNEAQVTALGTSDIRSLATWTRDLNSPTATGSTTARSLADRFADVANVKDYGDDIQSALDSGKGSVFIPDGTYVTDVLTVPSTVQRLYGTGTIKQQAAGNSKILTATSVTGLIIEGLTFEGIYTTANPPLSSNRGLEFTTCTDLRISNCTVKNVQERAIQLTGCENVIVHGNRLTQCGRGLYLTGTNRVTVSNNIIQDTITDISEFTIALALDSTDGHSYGVCNEVNISNNIIEGYFHGQGILAHGGRNVSIIGNTVKDPVQSIAIIPFQAGDSTQRFTVSGNTLECSTSAISGYTGQNGGITFQGDSDVSIPDPTDVAITGNTIINANRIVEQQYQGGIQIGYSERVQITGNTIINAACNGIVLTDTEESVTITGNVISSVLYSTTANSQNGILIRDVSKGIIDGNMFDNLTDTIGRGINFDGAAKITVGDNSFRDVTTNIRNDVRLLNVTSGTSLDLDNISTVLFNHSTPTTISTFTNVILDKIYTFRFNNSNTTIDRTNAVLNGGSNITGSTNDVVLMIGKSSTELRQVAPISVNS